MKNKISTILRGFLACCAFAVATLPFTACSDEPDSDNYYTFTGEMASDYLKNRPEYSDFATIVERAGLMDLLATYGHYTCFVPSNDAVQTFLRDKGVSSISDLSKEDCDTIAMTHIVNNMYSTLEMDQDRLATANMLGRYLATSVDTLTAEIVLEGLAHISYELKDDSVENGIMQPINMVIEKSNSYISDILRENPTISIFYNALMATGVNNEIALVDDPTWNPKDYPKHYYKSHTWNEVGWVPDTKKYGFTVFVEPDSLIRAKFQERGISTANGDMHALYDLACQIYDEVYPDDVNAEGHKFENLTDSVNPLHRYIQYHILNRNCPGTADLTVKVMKAGAINEAFGFFTKIVNPVEWYQTLLPHTMIKVEQLTMEKDEQGNDCRGKGTKNHHYLNRRYDANYQFEGAHVDPTVETDPVHDALNGHYFYVDDIVAFSHDVQNKVQNMRIRMDFSTVFPEVMTNSLRQVGNPFQDDSNTTPDDAAVPKNGRNFYFPMGYLDGVTFSSKTYCVLRRPHIGFWSWQGDEWNLFGEYDFTFRIPPVPFSGEWQLRLGFCAIETRGVMQCYFDGVPQGIPLDMQKYLDSELYLGDRFIFDEAEKGNYSQMSVEEKAEEQKLLRNLGAYRDGRSMYHFDGSGNRYFFVGNNRTYRRILCQSYIDATKDHYIRFRMASKSNQGNDNEFMLDFFEMVPKSVYAVDGDAEMEDDL